MFVDYSFYTDIFKGNLLTEDEFDRFGNQACMYISTNTLSRITDGGISSYPVEIQNNSKSCACALAEYLKQINNVQKSIAGSSSTSEGIVSSKTAGAVSISYDTKLTAQYFLEPKNQAETKYKILAQYLSPVCIGGKMYNLLSKVIGVCQ